MGMMPRITIAVLCVVASTAAAQDLALECRGEAPDWQLSMTSQSAEFTYIGTATMDIPQSSRAEGRASPQAFTLISSDYSGTAIVIVHDRACDLGQDARFDTEVQVLTQRNDTPVLLAGCCLDLGS